MHVRFSSAIGTLVVEAGSNAPIGVLEDVLIHPDKGIIEGFYVRVARFLHSELLFLPRLDIQHWGKRIRIRDEDALVPAEEIIRIEQLLEDGRFVLKQPVQTESGTQLGRCMDVQFNTKTFVLEWIFPKSFFRWGLPIAVSSILRVEKQAIIVRDSVALSDKASATSVLHTLDPRTQPAQS